MLGIGSGKFLLQSSFSATVLVGGHLQGWFPLTGLPWNLLAVPGILDSTSSQAHELAMSLKVRIKVTAYVSSRIIIRRRPCDLCCLYFSPEVMVKFTRRAMGHFMMLIENDMHLIMCISGHICLAPI